MPLNLGSITFGLAADTTGLASAQKTLENFGTRVDNAMRKVAMGAELNTSALQRQEGAAVRALQQVQNLTAKISQTRLDPKVSTEAIDRLQRVYTDFSKMMATPINSPLSSLAFQRASLGFKEQIDDITRAIAREKAASSSAADSVAANFEKQRLAVMRAQHQVEEMTAKIHVAQQAGAISPKVATRMTGLVQGAGQTYGAQLDGAKTLDAAGFLQAQLRLRTALNAVQRDLQATRAAANPLLGTMHGFGSAMEMTTGPLNGFVFRIRAATSLVREHGIAVGVTTAILAGFAASTVAVISAVGHSVIEYQKAEVQLKAISNNAAVATLEMNYVREAANRAGLEFNTTAQGFARFNAASAEAGISATKIHENFNSLSMLMGTLHLDRIDTQGVLRAFDQMYNKGKVQGEELMRQLTQYIPGAMGIAKRAAEDMGVDLYESMRKGTLAPVEFIEAWLKAAAEVYHLDISKPVQTFQGAINRVKNELMFMLVEMDRAFQITATLTQILNGVSDAFKWMAQNMDIVAGSMGILAGAAAGLVTVMAIQGTITAVAGAWGILTVALRGVKTATDLVIASQTALSIVMVSTPWGAIMMGIAKVGGALLGAKIGFDMMSQAADRNRASMNNGLDAISTYVEQQRVLKYNVAATTNEFIKQQKVILATDLSKFKEQRAEYSKTRTEALRLKEMADSNTSMGFDSTGLNAFASNRMKEAALLRQGVEDMTKSLGERLRLLKELDSLRALPEAPPAAMAPPTDKDKKGKTPPDPDRGLRTINDLINKASSAQELLDAMWRGPSHSGLLQALDEAKSRLYDMDPDQLQRITELMGAQNIDTAGGLTAALTMVILKTDMAAEAVREFNQVWQEIQQTTTEIQNLNKQLDYLQKGGDPEQMWFVQGVERASEILQKITNMDGPALRSTLEGLKDAAGRMVFSKGAIDDIVGTAAQDKTKAFAAIVQALDARAAELGITFDHTGTDAQDAEAGLAAFLGTAERLGQVIQETKQQITSLNIEFREFDSAAQIFGSIKSGSGLGDIRRMEQLFEATERFRTLQQLASSGDEQAQASLGTLTQMLEQHGFTVGTVSERYAAFLEAQYQQRDAIDTYTRSIEQQKEAWNSFASSSVDALRDIIMGATTMKDAIKNILNDLAVTVLNAAIFDPLKENLYNSIRGIYDQQGGARSGGGGWLGSLIQLGSKSMVPRASGGPMTAGGAYLINEPGSRGDLFIPGKSGYAVPNSELTSSERSVIIDASVKHIDARGATPDAVAMLMQELNKRDSRLRRELPFLIDSRVQSSQIRGRLS